MNKEELIPDEIGLNYLRARARWEEEDLGSVSFLGWNDGLRALSFPYELFKLSPEFMREFLENSQPRMDDREGLKQFWIGIRLFSECWPVGWESRYSRGLFFKTVIRSGKDSLVGVSDTTGKITRTHTPLEVYTIMRHSCRVYADILMLSKLPEVAYGVLRPYVNIGLLDEWRVFVKGGKVVGISQYNYHIPWDGHVDHEQKIAPRIHAFMVDVIHRMKVDNFVADLAYTDKDVEIQGGGTWKAGELKLIETNPWGLSDPCMFGEYAALDGSIRVFEPGSEASRAVEKMRDLYLWPPKEI